MPWCPYTNRDLREDEMSREHIIPLSLGGIDSFELPVCRQFNAYAGSRIDGAVANDVLVMLRRNELDIRGHSRKRPTFHTKRAKGSETGRPLQLTVDRRDGLKIWSPQSKREVQNEQSVEFSFQIDLDIDLKFVAKVGLAAGYFAYGDLFRQHVQHSELRTIMNTDLSALGDNIYKIETLADNRFSEDGDMRLQIIRKLCQAVPKHSIVGLLPGPKSFGVFVGILGHYLGFLNVPATTTEFPNSDSYRWGHVICPQYGQLKRTSFFSLLEKIAGHAKID